MPEEMEEPNPVWAILPILSRVPAGNYFSLGFWRRLLTISSAMENGTAS